MNHAKAKYPSGLIEDQLKEVKRDSIVHAEDSSIQEVYSAFVS